MGINFNSGNYNFNRNLKPLNNSNSNTKKTDKNGFTDAEVEEMKKLLKFELPPVNPTPADGVPEGWNSGYSLKNQQVGSFANVNKYNNFINARIRRG